MSTLRDLLATGAARALAAAASSGSVPGAAVETTATAAPASEVISYAQLNNLVRSAQRQLLAAFASSTLKPGGTIAFALPNSLENVVLFLAITGLGCVAAPLNPALTADEFVFYLEDAKAAGVLIPSSSLAASGAKPPAIVAAAKRTGVPVRGIEWSARVSDVVISPPSFEEHDVDAPRWKPHPDTAALLLHTSGTTGRPKQVPLTHGNLLRSAFNITKTYGLTPADRTFVVMPLFHVHGLVAALLSPLFSGGTTILPPRFSATTFWGELLAHRATWYTAVPTIHQILLESRDRLPPRDVIMRTLRFVRSCSSSLSPATLAHLQSAYGVPILEAYAMTEAAHQMTSNPLPPLQAKPGSVGLPHGTEIGILVEHPDGKVEMSTARPSPREGEVCIRGINVTPGYLANAPANISSFSATRDPSLWFRTGDQGKLDEQGYLFLTGRIKELINRGGEKISPLEVDAVLLKHPAVAEAVSFGADDAKYGQEVHAAVVLRDGHASVTGEEIAKWTHAHLAAFKCPKLVFVTKSLPRTATGKIQRRIVAQHFAAGSSKSKL
ncbi:putative acyl-CoA synthetase [Ramicandelaber brevisporus]|nr:putative acyl-CoA synthetase [Ramicandelaber brevisporus]KAI8866284.1 putative acyl-CoA synthetase [Ramicandelaber brevisporus]